jgi:hypothetical protein
MEQEEGEEAAREWGSDETNWTDLPSEITLGDIDRFVHSAAGSPNSQGSCALLGSTVDRSHLAVEGMCTREYPGNVKSRIIQQKSTRE